jgi:2'-5' RNA ligase
MVAWRKLTLDQPTLIAIATNIQARIASGEWAEENMQYIPHASTFLNQKRWEDEVITKKAKVKSSSIRNTSIVDSLTDRSWAD